MKLFLEPILKKKNLVDLDTLFPKINNLKFMILI